MDNYKLPVLATIKDAFRVPLTYGSALLKPLLLIAVLLIAVDVVELIVKKIYAIKGSPVPLFITILIGGLNLGFYILLAVSCHRLFLLGQHSIPEWGLFRWTAREWRFLLVMVVIGTLFYFLTILIKTLIGPYISIVTQWMHVKLQSMFEFYLSALPAIYITARFILLFPSVAVDDYLGLAKILRLTRGNGVRLAIVLVVFPFLLLVIPRLLSGYNTLVDFILLILDIPLIIIQVSVVSFCFKNLTQRQQE